MNDEPQKTTNEKPVSLSPLKFPEALRALLQVKAQEEAKDKGKPEKKRLRRISFSVVRWGAGGYFS